MFDLSFNLGAFSIYYPIIFVHILADNSHLFEKAENVRHQFLIELIIIQIYQTGLLQ